MTLRFRPSASRLAVSRRRVLTGAAAGLTLGAVGPVFKPAIAQGQRPVITHGVQTGDVMGSRAMVWSRADRPSRMIVEWSTTESFRDPRRVVGPAALEASDYAVKMDLTGLPAGQQIVYRVSFEDLHDLSRVSEPVMGRFRTAPGGRRDISFVWTGDTAGQGWGINPDFGGMRAYETMRRSNPDFFIHSGDTVYADNPMEAEVALDDGMVWRNLMIEEKAKVAETLPEFRGQYKYNLMDENVRRFNAEVPMFAQWDDHEVTNNWYPTEVLEDDRYTVKSVPLLAARATRAFHEFMPNRQFANDPERLHRVIHYGPSLDILVIDKRSFRGPNTANRQEERGPETALLGAEQIRWLKRALLDSDATWKVIASDMPIGLLVGDGDNFENGANGDGPVLGREHDIAEILRFIKNNGIRNTVWLTADVHYTAAHYYDPSQAVFQEFEPFWEFVSGPIHAGTFGPGTLDNTFGPQVRFSKHPEPGQRNLPPSAGLQFFGHVRIDGATEVMTVTLKDLDDNALYSVDLTPTV